MPVLSSDDRCFGGWDNINNNYVYHSRDTDPHCGKGFSLYLPAMTAVVLKKI